MKTMIIVGAGIAGLSTGCYAQMNGFDSYILEMHSLPGGVCTSWNRGEYIFDHCLHWVLGSSQGNSAYHLFEELGVAGTSEFHNTAVFRRVEACGRTLTAYTNLDQFEQELYRVFPDEKAAISRLIGDSRFYTKFNPPMDGDFGSFGFRDTLRILQYMPSFLRLKGMSIQEYLGMFKDPEAREMLSRLFPIQGLPALMMVLPLAYFHKNQGGYPLGGSLNFARAIESKYKSLGGSMSYAKRVTRIVIRDGAAKAVETEDGTIIEADIIVSACDGRTVLYDMLGGNYLTSRLREQYDNPSLWPPIVSISLGVKRDMEGEPELVDFRLDEPIAIAGQNIDWLGYCHYARDPSFAPSGSTVIKMQAETDYDYWCKLHQDRGAYRAEKHRVLNICIDELEKRLPGTTAEIDEADMATPITWERYTGNWRGSYEGWLPSVRSFGKFLPRELPGLKDFYMTGQWVFPGGGVPMCMAHARRLVKDICKRDKRPFIIG